MSPGWPTILLIALFALGSADRWRRDRSWVETTLPPAPGLALAGIAAGAVALALAVFLAAPLLEDVTARAIEWTDTATVRGSVLAFVTVAMLVGATAVARELVFHRWLLDRAVEAGAAPLPAAVLVAVAEGLATGGHFAARMGAALTGFGLALLYLGGGRRLAAAIACRLMFDLGALALVSLRWI
jgi:hypothetical protein